MEIEMECDQSAFEQQLAQLLISYIARDATDRIGAILANAGRRACEMLAAAENGDTDVTG